jgi:hypothetical protein
MNVLVFASPKGGSGKSTLAAPPVVHLHRHGGRVFSLTIVRVHLGLRTNCAGRMHSRFNDALPSGVADTNVITKG